MPGPQEGDDGVEDGEVEIMDAVEREGSARKTSIASPVFDASNAKEKGEDLPSSSSLEENELDAEICIPFLSKVKTKASPSRLGSNELIFNLSHILNPLPAINGCSPESIACYSIIGLDSDSLGCKI